MRAIRLLAVITALSGVLAAVARAQTPEEPSALVVTAENLMAGDDRHAALVGKGGAATDLLPGDVLRYVLRYTNTRREAVQNVVFSNPVPKGLRYVAGSASGSAANAVVAFSVDGGKSYSTQPMIQVVEQGRRRSVPAPAGMYTHVRWTVPGRVQSGAQVTAEFRAELADRPMAGNQP